MHRRLSEAVSVLILALVVVSAASAQQTDGRRSDDVIDLNRPVRGRISHGSG